MRVVFKYDIDIGIDFLFLRQRSLNQILKKKLDRVITLTEFFLAEECGDIASISMSLARG
jgi:hypothetical protein